MEAQALSEHQARLHRIDALLDNVERSAKRWKIMEALDQLRGAIELDEEQLVIRHFAHKVRRLFYTRHVRGAR